MKGKRYATEDKIRILREADRGERKIHEMYREKNIFEATCHRWRSQFGLMDLNEAQQLNELERENTELKKMLAESLLKNRVLEAARRKKALSPAHRLAAALDMVAAGLCSRRTACRILRLARSRQSANHDGAAVEEATA